MPVPSSITDLSLTASDNYPTGSESPTTTDDYFRAHAAFIALLRDSVDGLSGAVLTDGGTTGAAKIPSGTTAQRPGTPVNGYLRYNTDTSDLEAYIGGAWVARSTFTKAINEAAIVSVASAATTNIGAAAANTINITGTTTITAFDTIASGARRILVFSGVLTLAYNATSLILPGASNIATAAGDVAEFVSLGSGNWRCIGYQRASGTVFSKEYISAEQIITVGGALTLAHGLGVKPKLMVGSYICKTAEAGWSVGDEFNDAITYAYTDAGVNVATTGGSDTSNLYLVFQNGAGAMRVRHKTTGALATVTPANWRYIVRAWA